MTEPDTAENSAGGAEIDTDVGRLALIERDHRRLADLVAGLLDIDGGLAFYHAVVEGNGRFPLEWEEMIVRAQVAALPDRDDLRERLGVVEGLIAESRRDGSDAADDAADIARHAIVATSRGSIELDRREHDLLLKLMAGRASPAEAQSFYASLTPRQAAFPPEWELLVVRATVKAHPERDDLLKRQAELEERLGEGSEEAGLAFRHAFHRAWARFARTDLNAAMPDADRRALRGRALDDACAILSSQVFAEQDVARRVEIIVALHNTLMSAPSPDLPAVAELGMRRFRELLAEPELGEPQACAVFDCLHALYFAGVADTLELRRFDTLVPAFETWLERRHGRHERPAIDLSGKPLTIAYMFHTGHLQRGNAVGPLILSLAEMHSAQADRRILFYLVQHVDPDFVAHVEKRGVAVRAFPQGNSYDRIDEIAASLQADGVDVVVTEQNRAIAAALFVRRVVARQIWFDTGFPFWRLRALDWTISPVVANEGAASRASAITLRQSPDTLTSAVDEEEVAKVRAGLPDDAFLLGVFVRLVKLDPAFLDFLERLVGADPRFHLVIGGSGDSGRVEAFVARPGVAGRARFVPGLVDLNVYGPAIDVMCDTFPFIGGLACREVAAHGTPVVARLGTNWDPLLRLDRNPDLLAATEDEYIALVRRLADDPAFLKKQKKVALAKAAEYSEPTRMIDDVEAAIAASCR